MADPINPALEAALTAHIALLLPQITGLADLELLPFSDETLEVIRTERADRERRVALCRNLLTYLSNALTVLQALEADGYPGMPPGELSGAAYIELQDVQRKLLAAFAQIVPVAAATTMTISLGTPAAKS